MQAHKIIGILIVISSLGLIGYQATKNESTVTFFTPEEVYANPSEFSEKTFRVSGLVMEGSKQWDPATQTLTFRMSDLKNHDFLVTYKGIPPDLFKERQGVIVEGRMVKENKEHSGFHLTANLLMVKHSEIYDTVGEHSQMREMRLKESLFNEVQK